MEGDTASLRKAAPNWNLAGDKQLLGMLQQIHQSIVTKCQEANTKLEAMVDALENASIDLQNVNNKFMALSNSQFVESRVYDDDVDIKVEESSIKQETPKLQPESDLQKIKRSLQKLEMMHEPVVIVDSDSSDDEESSMVLKPKNVYSNRPVPYVIGSQAWKNKWHAGLLPEDSDSDSSLSNRDIAPAEEYSDSEPEIAEDVTDKHAQRTISSSSMESDVLSRSSQPRSAADVAAELARRLAASAHLPVPAPETTLSPPEPTTRKVYGVDKPLPATIFPSEPPPLDSYESDKSDDDIFAELHRKPNQNSYRDSNRSSFGANNVVDELFGDRSQTSDDIGNIVPDYVQVLPGGDLGGGISTPNSNIREDSPLFDKILPTHTNSEQQVKSTNKLTSSTPETNTKKPIGGISLFGSNKGAESIGAAILKRNQRKSTSEEDSSDVTESQTQPVKETGKESKKIIEELFTKPPVKKDKNIVKKETDNVKPVKDKDEAVEVKAKDKIDLFSDNLFDDIDDIFTTNVTKPTISKATKSIFDEDDLFNDVVESRDKPQEKKDTKSIFDSDDDLFSDNDKITSNIIKTSDINIDTHKNISKTTEENVKVKSIFDDNSDDDLFSDIANKSKPKVVEVKKDIYKNDITKSIDSEIKTTEESTSVNTLFPNVNNLKVDQNNKPNNKPSNNSMLIKQTQSPNLFDDDDDIDDLFSINTDQKVIKTLQKNVKEIPYSDEKKDELKIDVNLSTVENQNALDNSFGSTKISYDKEIMKQNVNDTKDNLNIQKPIITSNAENLDDNNFTEQGNNEKQEIVNEDGIIKTKSNDISREELNNDKLIETDNTPDPLLTEQKEPDVFSDIFNDLPPAFEKPSETKRSKNVNALFDDDSDDEALFFKKNEVINDEIPDLDFSSDRFRIFHDQPPDIEVDFSQKPLKSVNTESNEKPVDELFDEIPHVENNETKYHEEQLVSHPSKEAPDTTKNEPVQTVDITKLLEDFTDTKEDVNISKLLEDESDKDKNDEINNLNSESTVEKTIQNIEQNKSFEYESKDTTKSSEEDGTKKPIGKLKPMNFNINVNTLMPGASPKKNKINEETDGQILSTKSNEDINIHSPNNTDSKIVKSVSFDGNPDSSVLDNKLSKDRPKIQVKRRPSSRRARLEAVRKSGIDFGSDSTDNSSSFDEPKPIESSKDEIDTPILVATNKESDIQQIGPKTTKLSVHNYDSNMEHKSGDVTNTTIPEVKSKIVYILNDEDIFSNSSQNTSVNSENNNSEHNITIIGKANEESSKIGTISKDKSQDESKDKKPLFDDLSDEELFGSKKPSIQKTKDNVFDSDSEADLFSKSAVKPVEKKKVARASLFGDESDDDDLFASKTSKISDMKPTPQVQSTNNSTEVVFEDPLSLFGEDES